MLRHQPRPPSPWGACTLAAAAILVLLLLVPATWWQAVWLRTRLQPREAPPLSGRPDFVLLEIAGPQVVEVVPVMDKTVHDLPRELPDAAWWDRGWEVRVQTGLWPDVMPAAPDTTPWATLGALGLPTSLAAALTMPDSALTAKVWELVWEDKLSLREFADYFRAIGRSRVYADLRSREAAMFGEFIFETVPVTETGDD
jgi:hypothetical protein